MHEVRGYDEDDHPIFADDFDPPQPMCGGQRIAAPGMGGWCCLLRVGHTGGCWSSNPSWPNKGRRDPVTERYTNVVWDEKAGAHLFVDVPATAKVG